ncbi:aminotransferase-like domain-containing protein [Anaeromyxobacter diazotrophicus]|uniref:GntR family transcriptional regulator n=1 Tax=Anaeromyxobacter diazotrophicus TaxID=2590199 RepID=A0A7I9VHD8_9BACT|nr:PLP-dependent aminotransferase family protein [Anaeromyxobacter diazotrophicus]GEJ55794.1 GntR family transcriptional regulator [Anaeromyxobacter diazotrophicus]
MERGLPRYEAIARRFARAVEDGTLAPGEKLPSVRKMRVDEGVSASTVLQALAQLEAAGLVEARPRSGYYVKVRAVLPVPRPSAPAPHAATSLDGVSALVAGIYRAAADPGLIHLGTATPAPALLPTRALARAVAAEARRSVTGGIEVTYPPGLHALRRLVAQRAVAAGCELSEDDLIVTNGATEALQLALLAVTSRGDTVAVESPAYYGTLLAVEALGLRVMEVPCHPETGMDVDELARRMLERRVAAVLAVPSFSNPLGSCMPDESKRRLVELLADRAVPLLEDDVYGDLAFGPARPRPAKAFDRDGTVIYCGSFSKTLAPGFRLGYVAPGRWHDRVEVLKFATSVATATLTQRALARFLAEGGYDRHLRALRARLEHNVARAAAAVAAEFPAGTRVSRPRGGCFLWIEMPAEVDALELHGRALEMGVSIAPGHIFSASGAHASSLRISCGDPWSERIDGAIRLVGRLARRLLEAS